MNSEKETPPEAPEAATTEEPAIGSTVSPNHDLLADLKWPLILGALILAPPVFFYCQALWQEKSYRFFPILLIAPIYFLITHFREKSEPVRSRSPELRKNFGIGLGFMASVIAIIAAIYSNVWLGVAAFVLTVFTLLMLAIKQPWPRVGAWILPLALLLVIPTSPTDFDRWFDKTVIESASSILDLAAVPNLPEVEHESAQGLVVKDYVVAPRTVRTYLLSPYVLLCLTLFMVLWFKPGALVGAFALITVPAWAWLQSTVAAVLGVVLLQNFELNIFDGTNRWIATGILLLLSLLFLLLFVFGQKKLFSPLSNTSSSVGSTSNLHKLYNAVVIWPRKKESDRRRSQPEVEEAAVIQKVNFNWQPWVIGACFVAAAIVAVVMNIQGKA